MTLCMFAHVCVLLCMFACVCMFVCVCVCLDLVACGCACLCWFVYVRVYVRVVVYASFLGGYACVRVCVCVLRFVDVRVFVH